MKIFSKKIMQILPVFLISYLPCNGIITEIPKTFVEQTPQDSARQKLLSLCAGEWISRGVYVATKLEIADHLESGPKSVEELAHLTQSNSESLKRLLQMLVSFGVFEEVSSHVFSNTDVSRLLIKSSADSLRNLSIFYGEDINKSWSEILPSIQTGITAFEASFNQPVFAYFKNNPERASLFQAAMKEKSRAVIKSALSNYNFGQFNTICDIGAGYGQFVQALLQKYQNVSGMIFEIPEVIETIKTQNSHLQSDRCQLVAGDFFSEIPEGKDAYILKSVIHDWDDAKAELILRNCYRAMRPDSRLLIVEVVLQSGDNQSYANCMDFLMLAITGGKERHLSAMSQLLENCGLMIEKIYPTSTEFSILEVKKMSQPETFKNIAEEYTDRVWNKRDLSAIEDLLHPEIVIHSLLGDYHGQEAMKKVIDAWLTGFPDLVVKNIATIHKQDLIVIQWQAYGTHQGEFKNIKPTGKSITYEGETVYKIRDNKITEYWAYLDMQHILNQIR